MPLKVTTACNNCRRRKTKCDAQYPTCRPCLDRKEPICIYDPESDRRGSRMSSVPHARAHHGGFTEAEVPGVPMPSMSAQPADCFNSSMQPSSASSTGDTVPLRHPSPQHSQSIPNNTATPMEAESASRGADAMTGTSGDPSKSAEFFGRSSAGSFLRQVSSAIDTRFGRSQTDASTSDFIPRLQASQADSADISDFRDHGHYILPSRRHADNLLKAYYDLVWAVFPILDKTVFQAAYEAAWLGTTSVIPERLFYCMMNLIFALGSQFCHLIDPGQRRETGQLFWDRARVLFHPRTHDASLERVQCLLLMGLYLQSTSETHECWMTIGSAIRMAQSLGIHLPMPTTIISSRREQEIARRVWHGCVYQDRYATLHIQVLSMTFGRPSMIAKWLQAPSTLPAMLDCDFLDTHEPSAIRPDGSPMILAFFRKSLELYDIINDALIDLYLKSDDTRGKEIQRLTPVLDLDNRLIEWAQSLPEHLRYVRERPHEDLVIQRQRVVLRARYIQARMIVFRPILAEFYLGPPNSNLDQIVEQSLSRRLVVQCAEICFESAYEMIDVLYTNFNFDTVTGPVPAWWFGVLYVYTAATILLAERLKSIDGKHPTSGLWSMSWNKAVEMLNAYARVGESAKRCMAALSILSAKIQGAVDRIRVQGNAEAGHLAEQPDYSFGSNVQEAQQVGVIENMASMFDFENIDFDIDNIAWLNAPAADIMF